MKLKKYIESNIPFSLHDSKIKNIEVGADSLSLYLDKVFEYTDEIERFYPAKMQFTDIDFEECKVIVFNKTLSNGNFNGVVYDIKEYIDKFSDSKFEILTETYDGYTTILEGVIWTPNNEPISGIINIWTMGSIIFEF